MPERVPPGLGQVSKIAPPNPAAGAEISYTFPTAARYHILFINFQFATDANVANRSTLLEIYQPPTLVAYISATTFTIPASKTYRFMYAPGSNVYMDTARLNISLKLPSALYLAGTPQFATNTVNIQAGDQYSGISIFVARWIEPA